MQATRFGMALAFAVSGALAAMPCPAVAQDTTLIVHPRSFYYEGTQNTGKRNEAWTLGGWIGYRTPRFRNILVLGATVYGSLPLYAPAERDGTFLLKPGQETYVVLGDAFAALSLREIAVLKAGRQLVDHGYINPSDIRMTPFTFEGITIGGRSDSLRYHAGYLWQMKQWNADHFVSMAEQAGAVASTAGVAMAGVEFISTPELQLEITEQYGFDTFNTLYAKASYRRVLSDDWGVGVGLEYTDQRAVGDALAITSVRRKWRTHVGAARLQLFFRDLTLTAALSKTGAGSAIQNPWGTYPGYLSLIDAPASRGFARANEQGWLVGATYDSSPWLLVVVNIASGSGALDATTSASLPNQTEYDFRIESRWSSELGNLKLTVRGAFYHREDADRPGRQIHLILDWDLGRTAPDGRAAREVTR